MIQVLTYSLLANLSFSYGSYYFAIYSHKVNPLWVNAFKCLLCFSGICVAMIAFRINFFPLQLRDCLFLGLSGLLGLCIGDLFMLEAMKILGGSRVVMMFGLTPFFTGVASFFLFDSRLNSNLILGVCFMVGCLFVLALERYKISGQWHLKGIAFGTLAVFLDNLGLILTKSIFNRLPQLHVLEANLVRTMGALFGFFILNFCYRKIHLKSEFLKLTDREKSTISVASLFGAFISLFFYFKSVSAGHLSIVSSMAGTGPLFTEIITSLKQKKRPHPLWWLAFIFFLIALFIFIQASPP